MLVFSVQQCLLHQLKATTDIHTAVLKYMDVLLSALKIQSEFPLTHRCVYMTHISVKGCTFFQAHASQGPTKTGYYRLGGSIDPPFCLRGHGYTENAIWHFSAFNNETKSNFIYRTEKEVWWRSSGDFGTQETWFFFQMAWRICLISVCVNRKPHEKHVWMHMDVRPNHPKLSCMVWLISSGQP